MAVGKAAVLVLAEKVAGHGIVQRVLIAVHVVIYHVHHHADARRVQRRDHFPALPDAHLAPGGVGGVAALRYVEVGGVVAPVILPQQRLCLVHAAKIKNGHQLDVLYPQPLEVVQAGGVDAIAVQCGALLGKGHIFGKVYDHAADAVHTRRPGVGVAGLAGDAVHSDGKGVVAAVLLSGQPDAPHPMRPAHKGFCVQHGAAISLMV